MSLTQKNQLLIAFKKLLGKAHTSAKLGVPNESVSSNIQMGLNNVFSDVISLTPSTSNLYDISSGSSEYIQFDLVSIPLSQYASENGSLASTTIDEEGENLTNGYHAYALILPSNYVATSNNPKKGTGAFTDSNAITASNGTLQLVPPTYTNTYAGIVSSSSGIIAPLDAEDYIIDYNAGILFIQDVARVPTSVRAHLYIGNYASERISIPQLSGTVGVSGSFATFNTLTSSFGKITSLTASDAQISNNITVLGTASIAMLNTVNQQSLQIGDKYIIIMSGATDHTTLSGSGVLWGSGSSGPTVGPNGENAYIRFDSVSDLLEIFPGLETSVITASSISASNYVGVSIPINSGAAGRVAYYPSPGGTTIDDSGIYWDSATGYVGIGTPTPEKALDINGAQIIRGLRIFHSASTVDYKVEFGPGAGVGDDNENYGIFVPTGSSTGKRLALTVGGNGIFVSGTSAGSNLGVNTRTPDQKLVVSGTSILKFHVNDFGDISSNTSIRPHFSGANSDFTIYEGNVGSGILRLRVSSSSGDTNLAPSGGKVGIGTPTPTYKLDVNGTGRFSDDVEISGNTIISDNSANAALRITQTGAGLALRVEDEANPDSTPFVVDATGRVGIGVASPDEELVVSGNQVGTVTARIRNENNGSDSYSALIFGNDTSANKLLLFANSSNRGTAGQGGAGNSVIRTDSGKLIFGAAGSVSHVVDTNGNFGIGTLTASSYKLEVSGTISGSAVYGLSGASAQFPNFTNDVRAQFTAGTNITITNGQISSTAGGGGITSVYDEATLAGSSFNGLAFKGLAITASANGTNADITILQAGASQEGVVTTGSQTFAGNKTFNGNTTFGAAATNTVTMTATTMSLSTVLNIEDKTLYIDGNYNRVYVGNSTGSADLHVYGTSSEEAKSVLAVHGNTGGDIAATGNIVKIRNTRTNGRTSIEFQNSDGTRAASIGFGNTGGVPPYASNAYIDLENEATEFIVVNNSAKIFSVDNTGFVSASSLEVSNGITFPSAGASGNPSPTISSNILSDYEQGTWTPILSGSINGTVETGSNYTTASIENVYTRIGNKAFLQGRIEINDVLISTRGTLKIINLPFTSDGQARGPFICTSYADTNLSSSFFGITEGDTILLYKSAATSNSNLLGSDFKFNSSFRFSVSYTVS